MQHLSINVPLDETELTALLSMAADACRPPREHMRYLFRRYAQRRGLLPDTTQNKTSFTTPELGGTVVVSEAISNAL